jgi:site-specific DNA recombinase
MTQLASVLTALNGQVRIAFYGRTSNQDLQDPSLSIPRQLDRAKPAATELGGAITGHFYDIESGRKALAARGNGANAQTLNVPVARDGGLHDLLTRAEAGEFDAVIVESIDRIARAWATGNEIEQRLKKCGVLLLAADEPLTVDKSTILLRRIKMAMAEFIVNDLLEKSWDGMTESTRQGWHTGGPTPYGYALEEHLHPNPAKAKQGERKHKLVVDPLRARVVKQIFHWYVTEERGLGEIIRKLNGDLDLYPPPEPSNRCPGNLSPTWHRGTVQAILRNPKYTGFNVWNRHDKHAKHKPGAKTVKPKSEWVWSEAPTHEAIVPRELYDQVEAVAAANDNKAKRGGARANLGAQGGRSTTRVYPLRGHIKCEICKRRMSGTHQKTSNWYRCQFIGSRSPRAAEITGHPASLQVKEEPLLVATLDFLSRRVFQPERLEHLRGEMDTAVAIPTRDFGAEVAALRADHAKLEKKIDRLFEEIEDAEDRNDPFARRARQRIEQLGAEQAAIEARIAELEVEAAALPEPDSAAELEATLLSIPDISAALTSYSPEELRELFEALDLEVRYDKRNHSADISIALIPELLEGLLQPQSGSEAVSADFSPEKTRPATGAGQRSRSIAGAGFEPATSGL